jgi:hypothetical protein
MKKPGRQLRSVEEARAAAPGGGGSQAAASDSFAVMAQRGGAVMRHRKCQEPTWVVGLLPSFFLFSLYFQFVSECSFARAAFIVQHCFIISLY